MTGPLRFLSALEPLCNLSDAPPGTDDVRFEPGLFGYDPLGLPPGAVLARLFVSRVVGLLGPGWADAILDTRTHMLMPGFWPCIPGWHHDDVARTRCDGQPDYRDPKRRRTQHAMCIVDCGSGSLTEFVDGTVVLEEPAIGTTVYQVWDHELERRRAAHEIDTEAVRSGAIYTFDDEAFHRGMQATGHGWRWFGRLTLNSERERANKVRTQTQVYLSDPSVGW